MEQNTAVMNPIARIYSDFPTKFGIPRQSGLVEELQASVVMEPEYRNADAFRGLEEFSHIWLIWQFSAVPQEGWSPTVRPPRLGGNQRMGVFATRSPFRPNRMGLSCVRLLGIDFCGELGPVLRIAGADLMDGTPVFDIKPYVPLADCRPEAAGGFSDRFRSYHLQVQMGEQWKQKIPSEKLEAVLGVLGQDPRPSYQKDPDRIYGMEFAGLEIKFRVDGQVLTVCRVEKAADHSCQTENGRISGRTEKESEG